jgi:hypothetical protein
MFAAYKIAPARQVMARMSRVKVCRRSSEDSENLIAQGATNTARKVNTIPLQFIPRGINFPACAGALMETRARL